jgi:carboxyl-terminal processing protease
LDIHTSVVSGDFLADQPPICGAGILFAPGHNDETVVRDRDGHPIVEDVIHGSPAWVNGLAPGDAILDIGGTPTAGLESQQLVQLIRGPEGSTIELTVLQNDVLKRISIARAMVQAPLVTVKFDRGVGYIRPQGGGGDRFHMEFRQALRQLHKQGASGTILDLREHPGCRLDSAVEVVSELGAKKGALVLTTEKRWGKRNFLAIEPKLKLGEPKPLAVLVNGHTASGGEIIAGALQRLGLAEVIGMPTFGKGTAQALEAFFGGGGEPLLLKYTYAKWMLADGHWVGDGDRERRGVQPHQLVPSFGKVKCTGQNDRQYQHAHDWIMNKTRSRAVAMGQRPIDTPTC